MKPIRDHVLKNLGLTSVADEVYTPPLADATTIVQKHPLRRGRTSSCSSPPTCRDDKLLVDKFAELGLTANEDAEGRRRRPLVRARADEGRRRRRTWKACWSGWRTGPARQSSDVSKRFIERTKEPWFGHDSIFAYVHVMILKEAIERAGVADRHKVAQAIREHRHEGRAGAVLPRRAA